MDPNKNLLRQREILAELRELEEEAERQDEQGDSATSLREEQGDLLSELSDLTEGMDCWLSMGGFLPQAWHR